jgi:hypothetical protein
MRVKSCRCVQVTLVLAAYASGLQASCVHALAADIRSAANGPWSAPATWEGGRLPTSGDRVVIRAGHEVEYDVESDQVIRVLKIAGTLRFAGDRDTRLDAGLILVGPGEEIIEEGFDCAAHQVPPAQGQRGAHLAIGLPGAPISAGQRALVRLVHCEGMDKESCPAIVCCGGRMDFHGAPLRRTWVKLAATAARGTTELTLADTVDDWRPGDRVLVPSTARLILFDIGPGYQRVIPSVRDRTQTEERTIKEVRSDTLVLDEPLKHPHLGAAPKAGEVANLSRNVIVESAEPAGVRGHTMYHAGSSGAISYAEFRHLGKRGVLGRYSLHYHLCRDTMRGSFVVGASIHDSENRWLTVHGTDYLVVRDCVGYHSRGHGFFLEDGTEVFNVFDRNLAVQALHAAPLPRQMLPYDENEGAGFWWANSLNTFTRNVAAECDQYGFRFEATKTPEFDPVLNVPGADGTMRSVDIRTLPFVRFEDNEAHTQRRFALNLGGIRHVSDEADHRAVRTPGADLSKVQGGDVQGIGPDTRHPFVIRNFKVWNSHWVFHGGSPSVLIDGLDAVDCNYGIFKTRMDAHEYRNLRMERIDTAEIFEPWGNSTLAENYDRYLDLTDDRPPTTVITACVALEEGRWRVEGTTADSGRIKRVTVNGEKARSVRANYAQWEATLSAAPSGEIVAQAEDGAGNIEPRPHRVAVEHDLAE